MPEFTDITIPIYLVSLLFFYADYGILYEELLVRAKKTQVSMYIRISVCIAFTYDDLFQQHGCNSIELRNS